MIVRGTIFSLVITFLFILLAPGRFSMRRTLRSTLLITLPMPLRRLLLLANLVHLRLRHQVELYILAKGWRVRNSYFIPVYLSYYYCVTWL